MFRSPTTLGLHPRLSHTVPPALNNATSKSASEGFNLSCYRSLGIVPYLALSCSASCFSHHADLLILGGIRIESHPNRELVAAVDLASSIL